jgi:hypothetical protein
MVKIAVIGSRNFSDYSFFREKLEAIIINLKDFEFVSGGCKSGGDALIKKYCNENQYKLVEHLPDWDAYGKRAGFLRNQLIIDDATHLIAYWDGASKGTLSSIKMAENKEIPIKIVKI